MRFVLASCLLLTTSNAHAADFTATINGPDDKPFPACQDSTDACKKPLTLGAVASGALFTPFPDEHDPRGQPLSGDEAVKRAELGLRIYNAKGEMPLTADETVLVKKVVAKMPYSPLIVMRVWTLLDPASRK